MIYLKFTKLIDLVKKIKTEYLQFQEAKRNSLENQLRDKSLRIKLLKKKIRQSYKRNFENEERELNIFIFKDFQEQLPKSIQSNSKNIIDQADINQIENDNNEKRPSQKQLNSKGYLSDVPEFTIRSKISSAESDCNATNVKVGSYIIDTEDAQGQLLEITSQQDGYRKQLSNECQSFSSFIDLNQLIQEVEQEQEEKIVNLQRQRKGLERSLPKEKDLDRFESPRKVSKEQKEMRKSQEMRNEQRHKTVIQQVNYDWEMDQDIKIPKELLKYSPQAYNEWVKIQKDYQRWFLSKKTEIARGCDQKDLAQKVLELHVPELFVRVPKDESNLEVSASQEED